MSDDQARRSPEDPGGGKHRLRLSVGALAVLAATIGTAVVAHGAGDQPAHDGVDHPTESTLEDHSAHHVVADALDADPDQIALIESAMAKYRDIEVALDDGWVQEHPDWPGTGAHFYREEDWTEIGPVRPELDPLDPEYLMYSRLRTGEWELVAVAYVVDQALFPEPPTDLRGAAYHAHVWTCIVDDEELEEDEYGPVSRDECQAMDGEWSPGGVWMTHVWFIDNPDGRFAEENPELV